MAAVYRVVSHRAGSNAIGRDAQMPKYATSMRERLSLRLSVVPFSAFKDVLAREAWIVSSNARGETG